MRLAFVVLGSVDELLRNTIDRGSSVPDKRDAEVRRIAAMNRLFTPWRKREASSRLLPVMPMQPWETLAVRILGTDGHVHHAG